MNIEDVRKLETEDLIKEKQSVIKNTMENRFKHKSMQLSDTSQIDKLRKDKAKILTVINERKILAKLEVTEEDRQNE
jgi:ribosomal protein L29|tara:strand:- start:2182 stop:2412 length:231 start_codon:yes stop_codon:yes gene_type:complete